MPVIQFSVIITCCNQRQFIADAVESAVLQTEPNCEVIVVDDASSDGSSEILEKFRDRVKIVRFEKNAGAAAARNAGAFLAEGRYLAFLDGDDKLKPWALEIYERIIEAYDPRLILATLSWFRGIAPVCLGTIAPIEVDVVNYDCLAQKDRSYRSSASALVIERSAFLSAGGWAREASPFEDQHLEAKLAFAGRAITVVSPQTVFYRLHENNTIHNVRKIINGCYGLVAAGLPALPGVGMGARLGRDAIIGGPAFWAVKKAFRAKLYVEGAKLFVWVSPWVASAVLARLRAKLAGLRPTERLILDARRDGPRQVESGPAVAQAHVTAAAGAFGNSGPVKRSPD
jgi:hypothetical protein